MSASIEPFRPCFAQPAASPSDLREAFLPGFISQNVTVMVETDSYGRFPLLAGTGGEEPTSRSTPTTAMPQGWSASTFPARTRRLQLPLGMLAAVCLAWPVTSFILARRRKGRGFAVEGVSVEG